MAVVSRNDGRGRAGRWPWSRGMATVVACDDRTGAA